MEKVLELLLHSRILVLKTDEQKQELRYAVDIKKIIAKLRMKLFANTICKQYSPYSARIIRALKKFQCLQD